MMKEYLTPGEVQEIYGLSMKWLANQRWAKKGIPYIKTGRKVLYKKEDVEAFLEGRKIKVNQE